MINALVSFYIWSVTQKCHCFPHSSEIPSAVLIHRKSSWTLTFAFHFILRTLNSTWASTGNFKILCISILQYQNHPSLTLLLPRWNDLSGSWFGNSNFLEWNFIYRSEIYHPRCSLNRLPTIIFICYVRDLYTNR